MRRTVLLLFVALLAAAPNTASSDTTDGQPIVEKFLTSGELAAGEKALSRHLEGHPDDDQVRFELGVLQVVRAVERLGQSLYRYGAKGQRSMLLGMMGGNFGAGGGVPILRMPVPKNPDPERIDYQQARRILERFAADLEKAEMTLAQVDDPDVEVPLHFGLIRLDLNGDGVRDEKEKLWRVYASIFRRNRNVTRATAESFVISFDKADAHWLRGYCHLLMAMCDVGLAYDWSELFERTGHVFFANIESPYSVTQSPSGGFIGPILDEVAMFHLVRFPVKEPKRLESALGHLETMIEQSRLTWKAIQAEDDDNREWIPGPRQTGVIPGIRVTQQMVDAWHEFLDEAEALLAGDKLIPFWRTNGKGLGVNLRRVFTEPREFDLILWVHGSAAVPYLEEGDLSSADTWRRLQNVFGGQFIGFAVWFN